GMMCGQLTAGSLFARGPHWTFGAALAVATGNCGLALFAVRLVRRPAAPQHGQPPHAAEVVEPAIAFQRLSWIAQLGGMFGGSMVFHLLPDLAVTIGVKASDHGVLLASWRGVIIATYIVMHFVAFWHYRFVAALGSQVLAIVGLVMIAQAN